MSDETKALAHAIASLARSNLDMVTEMKQGRIVNQEMAATLVRIHECQNGIIERMDRQHMRSNDHEKRQGQSDGKIKILERSYEHLAGRVKVLEETDPRRSA